jgi:hypothetical protein
VVTRKIEVGGVTVVANGAFNPAIFQPRWFVENKLLVDEDATVALEKIAVTTQVTSFGAGWLQVQVVPQQAVFLTVEEAREPDLRNLVTSVFELLPHTPVDAVGINADAHFRVESQDVWHAIGDRFLPKKDWEPLFTGDDWLKRPSGMKAGLRTMMVEAWRPNKKDYVRIEVAPSVRITPNGVFIGINSHFQLTENDNRGTAHVAAGVVAKQWDSVRAFEKESQSRIMEWTE